MVPAMQKLLLLISVLAFSACTVDRELDGLEDSGPLSRIQEWWYGNDGDE